MKQRLEINQAVPHAQLSNKSTQTIINKICDEIEAHRPLKMERVKVDAFYIDHKNSQNIVNAHKIILSALVKSGIIKSEDQVFCFNDHFFKKGKGPRFVLFLDDLQTITECQTKEVYIYEL